MKLYFTRYNNIDVSEFIPGVALLISDVMTRSSIPNILDLTRGSERIRGHKVTWEQFG